MANHCCAHKHIITPENVDDTRQNFHSNYPTMLHMAVREECVECVNWLLIELRANPNVRDAGGDTPLHDAVRTYNYGMVKRLIHHKANVNLKNRVGSTPLSNFLI